MTDLAVPRAILRTFKRMQDHLGIWHDFVVLSQQMLRLITNEEVACHDQQLCTELLSMARTVWQRGQGRLQQFGKLWNAEGPQLIQDILKSVAPRPQAPVVSPDSPAPAPAAQEPPVDTGDGPPLSLVELTEPQP